MTHHVLSLTVKTILLNGVDFPRVSLFAWFACLVCLVVYFFTCGFAADFVLLAPKHLPMANPSPETPPFDGPTSVFVPY